MNHLLKNINASLGQPIHKVLWLSPDLVKSKITDIPAIAYLEKYPTKKDEIIELYGLGLGGRQLNYVDKKVNPERYDSVVEANRARDKNYEHRKDNEFRIHFNTGDFEPPYNANSLYYLVKHIKLKVPSIREFCESI